MAEKKMLYSKRIKRMVLFDSGAGSTSYVTGEDDEVKNSEKIV